MNEERRPNPYRPDPPIFDPVIFDDDEPLRPATGRRGRVEVDPDDREVFDSSPVIGDPVTGRERERVEWNWDGDDLDDHDDRGGRGGGGGGRGSGGGRGPGDYASDRGLVRIVALVGVLAVIVLALVLPFSPVRIIGRGGSSAGADGITATPRSSLPDLPGGFVALSKLYDVKVPDGAKGPWAIEVTLNESTTDANNLGFYAHDGTRWTRVAPVALARDGASVSGDVTSPPGSLAVLRRTGQAKALALIVNAGDRVDPAPLEATSIVAVMGASVGADGTLQATGGAVKAVAPGAGKAKVYFGVTAAGDGQGAVKHLASPTAMSAHADAIAIAAKGEGASGVYLDYANIPAGQKDAFTSLVKALRERLQKDQLGLVVGVPAGAGANGAYDWNALIGTSDGLWVRGANDPVAYHDQLDQLLTARKADKTDLGKVSLVIDRRSIDRVGQQSSMISLRDALTAASAIDRGGMTAPPAPGGTIALKAQNLGNPQQGGGLRWDTGTRMVGFAYTGNGGTHNVWIENRFSAAFRMDLAAKHGVGGIVVDAAKQDEALPALWPTVVQFVQDGSVKLERPFGAYLAPCWQATQGTIEGASGCWTSDSAPTAVNWKAPAQQGVYNVRLTVSDGATFIAQEVSMNVGGATPTATPSATSTATPTATARPGTATPTATATGTPRPTGTATSTPSATATATSTPGGTSTPPPIQTSTPTPSGTPPAGGTPFPTGVPPGPAGQ